MTRLIMFVLMYVYNRHKLLDLVSLRSVILSDCARVPQVRDRISIPGSAKDYSILHSGQTHSGPTEPPV
jgi:hypothetical protein